MKTPARGARVGAVPVRAGGQKVVPQEHTTES